jgi:hypothetical protein
MTNKFIEFFAGDDMPWRTKFVLNALCAIADDEGNVRATAYEIRRRTCFGMRLASEAMNNLTQAGYITKHDPENADVWTEYKLNTDSSRTSRRRSIYGAIYGYVGDEA